MVPRRTLAALALMAALLPAAALAGPDAPPAARPMVEGVRSMVISGLALPMDSRINMPGKRLPDGALAAGEVFVSASFTTDGGVTSSVDYRFAGWGKNGPVVEVLVGGQKKPNRFALTPGADGSVMLGTPSGVMRLAPVAGDAKQAILTLVVADSYTLSPTTKP
ncbi:MAG: hypothetical protein JWP35_2034 [Caulobacter sp.]|nr:hypothetical protein [Caulobacter sp.]